MITIAKTLFYAVLKAIRFLVELKRELFQVLLGKVLLVVTLKKEISMIPVNLIPATAAYYMNGVPVYYMDGQYVCYMDKNPKGAYSNTGEQYYLVDGGMACLS